MIDIYDIIFWVFFGGLVGILANFLVKGKMKGCIGSILVGILGSFVGGIIFNYFGKAGVTGFNFNSILVGLIGSVVLLILLNIIRKLGS